MGVQLPSSKAVQKNPKMFRRYFMLVTIYLFIILARYTSAMSVPRYLLKIDVSPFGGQSTSRTLGGAFTKAFSAANPSTEIRVRDLATTPVPLLDGEVISAGFVPVEARSPSQQAKYQLRLELIKEITEASEIVITTPMWNWGVPAVLKAYIDQIIMIGSLDPYGCKKLAGKKVTVFVGSGFGYGPESEHRATDFLAPYLKHIFNVLGSEDVQVIAGEYTVAGKKPGFEAFIPLKEKSLTDGIIAAEARAT